MRILRGAALPVLALALAGCSGGSVATSPSGAVPTAASPSVTSEADYCAIVNAGTAFDSDVGSMTDDLNALVADSATLGDPATLAAVHAQGAVLLDASIGTAAYFNQIAAAVNDPAVAAAYAGIGDWTVAYYQAVGQAAVDAPTASDYVTTFADIANSTTVTDLVAQRPGWSTLINNYFDANCT